MQPRLAEELRALQLDNRATLFCPGGVDYSTSIQRVVAVSVAATGASLVFPSSGSTSSSSSSSTSLSSTGSAVVTPSSGPESYKLLRMEAFRDLSEIASHMVNDGYTEGLITEFSRHQSCSGGDAILQIWFSELGVDWVLGVDASSLHGETWSAVEDMIKQWVAAFTVMAEALRLTMPTLGSEAMMAPAPVVAFSTDRNSVSKSAPPSAAQSSWMLHAASRGSSDLDQQESSDPARHRSIDVAAVKEAIIAYSAAETRQYLGFGLEGPGPQNQFEIFAEASLVKMLRFPHVVAALKRSPEKILRMIDMYSLVSDASPGLLALLSGGSKGLVSRTIESVLQTMSGAVWQILQNLTALIRAEDSWRTIMPSNGDIHPVNQYTVNYINLLLENCAVLDSMLRRRRRRLLEVDNEPILFASEEAFLFRERSKDGPSLSATVVELINSLDAMLEEKSKVHAAAGRRCVFLLNNAYFILQQAEPALRKFLGTWSVGYRESQIERYIEVYLNASWGPVTACLAATKQRRSSVFRRVSALVEFKASLQTTYQRQKLWKINSPQLRSRLREAVSNKVVSAYRAYLENHASIETSDAYTPEDLEDLFRDLFEG